jgi:biopolymer transport protein ExbD
MLIRVLAVLMLTVAMMTLPDKPRAMAPSAGVEVLLAYVETHDCGDGPTFLVRVRNGSVLQLNGRMMDRAAAMHELKLIYEYRHTLLVMITAEPDVSYQHFMDVVGQIKGIHAGVWVALVTPSQLNWRPPAFEVDCFVVSPPGPREKLLFNVPGLTD